MERRFFDRTDVAANGELIWATKGVLGKVSTHRAYLMTENLSVDGAKIVIHGKHHLAEGARARLKLGLEFADVELLDITHPTPDHTDVRLRFLAPHRGFLEEVEKYLPSSSRRERTAFEDNWIGSNYW